VSVEKGQKTLYNAVDVIPSDPCAICTERELALQVQSKYEQTLVSIQIRKFDHLTTMKAHHALHNETIVFRQLTVIVAIDLDVYHSP
jgi:hypothetical protein